MEMRSYSHSCLASATSPTSCPGRQRSGKFKCWSNSLPNLNSAGSSTGHNGSSCDCFSSDARENAVYKSPSSAKVIPSLLQKTWNKIKSMNKKRTSAPSTPSSLQKFDFDQPSSPPPPTSPTFLEPSSFMVVVKDNEISNETADEECHRAVHENYLKLQRRLSEELHQSPVGLMMIKSKASGATNEVSSSSSCGAQNCHVGGFSNSPPATGGGSCTSWDKTCAGSFNDYYVPPANAEFKRKLQQWEMWKASCGKVTLTDEELKLILPEDFSRKLKEWESLRTGGSGSGGGPNCTSSSSTCSTVSAAGAATGLTVLMTPPSVASSRSVSPNLSCSAAVGAITATTANGKIEKQIQWLERQLEKVEQEKSKLEVQMRKYLEKEARLEKMREALRNYPREQVLVRTATAEGIIAGDDGNFTKKLYKWEKMNKIPAEVGSMALLNPKYFQQPGASSSNSASAATSSEQLASAEDATDEVETSQEDLLEGENTAETCSSLESINQVSESAATSCSVDFYSKLRRRSSDAVSTPLSARSPSLSAFTSDDEDAPGATGENNCSAALLKPVTEHDEIEPCGKRSKAAADAAAATATTANPVVRVNQIVVEEGAGGDAQVASSNIIVQTKRTLIKPIEEDIDLEPQEHASLINPIEPEEEKEQGSSAAPISQPPLQSCSLERGTSFQSAKSSCSSSSRHSFSISGGNTRVSTTSQDPDLVAAAASSEVPPSPTKLRAEDIWNKNIQASPPPIRDGPRVIGYIPKVPQSSSSSSTNYINPYVGKPVFQHHNHPEGLMIRNFPKMGKTPVWVSPLVARRKMNYKVTKEAVSHQQLLDNDQFSLDRFIENRNLISMLAGEEHEDETLMLKRASSKYTIGGGFSPSRDAEGTDGGVRLVSVTRTGSLRREFGAEPTLGQGPQQDAQSGQERMELSSSKVAKSKSASSLLKSSLNLFSKVRRSETFRLSGAREGGGGSSGNSYLGGGEEPGESVRTTKAKWFHNL